MKLQILMVFAIFTIVFISGCTSETMPINGVNGLIQSCEPDHIFGGTLQKVTGMHTNFNTTCSNMCDNKYKITSYRIDEKTETLSMCYCDINECQTNS